MRPTEGKGYIQVHTVTQRQSRGPVTCSRALGTFEAEDYGNLEDSIDHGADSDVNFPQYLQ